MNNGGKRITTYSLSPEAEGKVEYVSPFIASYITHKCDYCLERFYLVDPDTQRSGGCVQREILKHKTTNERIPTNRVHGMCLACFHEILRRQQQERS